MARQWSLLTIVQAMRPRQWTKNVLLFAGLVLSKNLFSLEPGLRAVAGFVLFCMMSGAIYLLNDVVDYPRDRLHPRKRNRPIASGRLPAGVALRAAIVVGAATLGVSFTLSPYFGLCATAYLLMMIAYSLTLKEVFLIDTLILAMGFIIRAVSGVIVLRTPSHSVELTSWFVLCVMFLSLLLAFCKRRSERVGLNDQGLAFRPVLQLYSLDLLDKVIAVCAAGAILSYALWAQTTLNPWMMLTTLPFVLYGIFRYLHLVYNRQEGEAPELVLTGDLPLLASIAMWAIVLSFVFLSTK